MNRGLSIFSTIFSKPIKFKLGNQFPHSQVFCQRYTVSSKKVEKGSIKDDPKTEENWIPVFKFPYIRLAASVSKFKYIQYGVTILSSPISYGLEYLAFAPEGTALVVTSLCKL